MQLIVLIILLTGLWISFVLPCILSKIERPAMNLEALKLELEPKIELKIDGPDFYEYVDGDQIVRAEKGSVMYMIIHQSLNRRR